MEIFKVMPSFSDVSAERLHAMKNKVPIVGNFVLVKQTI